MQTVRYKVILTGEVAPGNTVETVKRNLANLFKVTIERIDLLFTGRPALIKDKLDYDTAIKYEQNLRRAGAICSIEPVQGLSSTDQPVKQVMPDQGATVGTKTLIRKVVFGIVWFVLLFLSACFVAGFIAALGAGANATDPAIAGAAGTAAAEAIVDKYTNLFLLGSFASALLGTVFGILPGTWKKEVEGADY